MGEEEEEGGVGLEMGREGARAGGRLPCARLGTPSQQAASILARARQGARGDRAKQRRLPILECESHIELLCACLAGGGGVDSAPLDGTQPG